MTKKFLLPTVLIAALLTFAPPSSAKSSKVYRMANVIKLSACKATSPNAGIDATLQLRFQKLTLTKAAPTTLSIAKSKSFKKKPTPRSAKIRYRFSDAKSKVLLAKGTLDVPRSTKYSGAVPRFEIAPDVTLKLEITSSFKQGKKTYSYKTSSETEGPTASQIASLPNPC